MKYICVCVCGGMVCLCWEGIRVIIICGVGGGGEEEEDSVVEEKRRRRIVAALLWNGCEAS